MNRKKVYHVINGRDITHRSGVARASLDLQTIRDGLSNTEVDEVIPEEC